MEVELALEIVTELLAPKYLNPPQEMVFRAVWDGSSYRDVAETVGYDCDYIRGVGAQIWRMLATATEKRVSKNNFRQLLESLVSDLDRAMPQDRQLTQSKIDWGETVDVSVFYGREREYARLYQWLTTDRCRLVTILGMGGMGKTTIASELARKLRSTADNAAPTGAEAHIDGFSHVLWRSLFNAQPLIVLLPELIREIIGGLPTQSISSKFRGNLSKKTVPDLIELLLEICQQYRCAIVLDNAESIFQSGAQVGQYRAGYADYGELFMTMGRMTHQSCLLLTSREKPTEIGQLEGINAKVRTLPLPGLDPASGQQIFADRGCLPVSAAEWTEIDKYYGGNPLAFQLIAAAVKEVADGDVSEIFPHLRSHKLSFADIQILLCQQWERLTPAEQQVMYWLAIDREPMSLVDLEAALHPAWNHQLQTVPNRGATSLLTILQFLRRRSMLLTLSSRLHGGGRYWSLQPMIMEYVTGRFVTQICAEIAANKPFLLDTHSIVQANAKEYIRQAQLQTIVQPAIDLLRISIGNSHQIGLQLRQILTEWRSSKPLATGYLAGNILNFLAYLKLDLTDLDCSELVIRQAYLAEIDLQQINLTNAQIVNCAFTQTFSAILAIAYSPDGSVLAASDTNGEIRLWRVSDGQCLLVCSGHTNWVRAIKFSPDGRYLASSSDDRSIKLWDRQDGTCLQTIGEGIHSMGFCFSPDGHYLVSGSDNNSIYYWDLQTGICVRQFAGHQGWSIAVDIHPQGHQLVSGSADGSVRLWNLNTGCCERVWQDHENWVTTVDYSPDGKTILSGSLDGTLRLWDVSSGKCLRVSTEHGGEIWSAAFSPDGTCFASAGVGGLLWIWRTTDGHCLQRLEGHSQRLWSVAFQPDGLRLASGGEDRAIRFWQVSDGKCLQVLNGSTA